jgi:hypothetical protein
MRCHILHTIAVLQMIFTFCACGVNDTACTVHAVSMTLHAFQKIRISSRIRIYIRKGLVPLKVPLKGQCHKMVVEVNPWSGSLALN